MAYLWNEKGETEATFREMGAVVKAVDTAVRQAAARVNFMV